MKKISAIGWKMFVSIKKNVKKTYIFLIAYFTLVGRLIYYIVGC